ncbi:hypothetical protein HP10700_08576 [Helicobacter pylori 10700]|nr:hypothetical protein HP10700_08576 [Helicobacter pylori 10700]
MIYTPMLYIMTYAILGSAKDFRENQSAIFLCLLFYALTHSFFIAFKSQSPGMRYARFKLVKITAKKWAFFGVVALYFVGVKHGVTHRVCYAFYF